MRPLCIFLTFASPPHNMSGLNLPPIDSSLRQFVTYTVDAEKFEGTATSNADRTDYRISPDIETRTGATISVNIPKKPFGEASCTAAWDSAPDEQGFVIRTSGHQTLRSLCTSVVLRNSEGTVCTAVWLQGTGIRTTFGISVRPRPDQDIQVSSHGHRRRIEIAVFTHDTVHQNFEWRDRGGRVERMG